ncbi:MAG: HYR domain-containing protein, partial [Fluviicola sp.]|nr:HYR domain-containing protein [Fluviicola sp.]
MKRFLLLILLLITVKSHATHILGADMYYQQISANQYKIILKVYRDCAGVALAATQSITLSNAGVAGSLQTVNLTRQSITILPNICSSITNRCVSATGTYGIEEHLYSATVNFNPLWGSIDARLSVCCHSNSITSMTAAGSENIYLTTTINRPTTTTNTGPVFLNSPVYYTPTSVTGNYTYSHLAFDPDGDSLAYSLEPTYEAFNNIVEYAAGYSGAVPFGAGSTTTINPITGLMTITNVTTNRCATYVVAVKEYRNGVLLSTSRREVALMFRTPANGPQTISDFFNTAGSNITFGCATGIYTDTLTVTDVDPADVLNVTVTATSPFITIQTITPSNPVQVIVQYNLDSLVAGNFQLTINSNDGRCPFPYTSSRTFNLSIGDSIPPTISCPGDTTLPKNASCSLALPDFTSLATATDNCGVQSIIQLPAPGTIVSSNTTVYLIAKDFKNQRDTCTFQVTLVDLTPPTITCVSNISAGTTSAACGEVVAFSTPTAIDNCGGVITINQTAGLPSGSLFPIGITTNTFTATDISGNSSSCSFTITVSD